MRLGPGGAARVGAAALVLAMSAVLSGCAHFDDSAASPFTPEPTGGAHTQRPPTTPPERPRPKGPCIDPDRAVVGTCLDTTGGLIPIDSTSALVAERRTGRIMHVISDHPPVEATRISVDGSGDGGLLSIALSPSYVEDGLLYAYITTASDNRVVRIAKGDAPKEILTGIPKGATGNNGAIMFVSPTQLLVLTGDAGNPAAAADPASLAGKLLRVGNPTPGRTSPPSVALSGIGTAGGLCADPKGNVWVTDRTAVEDRLQRVGADGTVAPAAWTWPDHPGVGGCAASDETVSIALAAAKAVAVATIDSKTFAVTTAPTLVVQNRYGMLNAAAIGSDGTVWAATVNKNPGGQPGPNDDRVVKIPKPGAGGGPD